MTVPARRAGRPSPPCSSRPRSRSHRGGPSGWSTRNSSSRSPIVMWSASTTDISEGRSSGTVRPSRVSTRPSKSSGSSPNSSRTSSCTRTRPVSMARLKPPGGRSAPSAVTGGSGKATASATRARHVRSSASKPPGRSLTASRQPPPSWRTGRAARWNSRRGVRRDWDWAARSLRAEPHRPPAVRLGDRAAVSGGGVAVAHPAHGARQPGGLRQAQQLAVLAEGVEAGEGGPGEDQGLLQDAAQPVGRVGSAESAPRAPSARSVLVLRPAAPSPTTLAITAPKGHGRSPCARTARGRAAPLSTRGVRPARGSDARDRARCA